MAASMDLNVQMDQLMAIGRPSRKAKEDANNKIIITDSHNFQHHPVSNVDSGHLQPLGNAHYNNYYDANSNPNVMAMNMEGGYVDYTMPINMNPAYNQVNSEYRAKSFDIASINHNEQNKVQMTDDAMTGTNMGPPAAKRRRGRQPNQPNIPNGQDSDNSLYAAVRYGRAPIQSLVDEWIEQYNSDRVSAMLDLMQFFISSCGCKGKITQEIFTAQVSQAQVIRQLTEEFDEDNGEYPLIQTTPQAKRFRSNFVEFISVLIRQCQYSIIYDQQMIDQLTSLLTVLTDSQVRAFRHTGTLASMKLMTALVDVALNISINRDNNTRQLEAERNKAQPAQARMSLLSNRKREFDDNLTEVKNMLTFLVKGVFVHRYRDSQADIRCICMQEIGVWMHRLPEIFLDDSYLKYVGWTLFDRVGSVRAQCLKTLQPLYEEAGLFNKLELFTSRFKSRLVDMTLDKEADVAVLAVNVVCCILRHNESVLDDKDCENVYELVYCTNHALAQAAGEFLSRKLFQIDLNAPIKKSRKGKRRSENTPLMRDLVQFFIESELHEHAGYLVDSLWDVSQHRSSSNNNNGPGAHNMIRDWECMTDLLLEEPGKGEATLTPAQETALIEILYWSVRQAATGESPVGRSASSHHHTQTIPSLSSNIPGGANYGLPGNSDSRFGTGPHQPVKLNKLILDDRNRLTEVLIPTLPLLIAKFSEDAQKMLNIVQLPLYMSLEMYTSGRHERYLDLLIKHLQQLVDRVTDPEILLYVSQVFSALCQDELSISTKCQIALGTLLDKIVESYRLSYNQYYSITTNNPENSTETTEDGGTSSEPSQKDAYRLHSALRILYAFYTCHDLRSLGLWESLLRICYSAHNQAVFHEEIVANAISTCYFALLWQLNHDDPAGSLSQAEINVIQKNLREFFSVCYSYLEHKSHKIAEQSFKSICDLLVICSRCVKEEMPDQAPFTFTPDGDLQNALILFLEQRVFIDDDAEDDENVKLEDLHNRRTNLAMFLKLMVCNVIPIRAVSLVYKSYIRFFNDFGDIMKTALAKAREINRVHTARMVMDCLISGLDDLIAEEISNLDRSCEGFQALKELARRLNLCFGLDLVKIREAMTELHKMAVDAVLSRMITPPNPVPDEPAPIPTSPSNLLCLELAAEFSNKLTQTDKRVILDMVTRAFPSQCLATTCNSDQAEPIPPQGWASLHNYRVSLDPSLAGSTSMGGGPDAHSSHSAGSHELAQNRPRGRPRKSNQSNAQNQSHLPELPTDQNPDSPSTAVVTKKKRLVLTVNTVNNTTTSHHNDDNQSNSDAQSPSNEPTNTPLISNRGRVIKTRINYSEAEG